MVLKLIKKAFGVGSESQQAPEAAVENKGLTGFVEYVVTQLVDSSKDVNINTKDENGQTVIEVTCAKPDMGKVIGKRGKTIAAIRTLVSSAARRDDKKVSVEVLD